MNGSLDTFGNMHKPEFDRGEGKSTADDGDGMRHTTCSTKIFSEMPTLESLPTLSDFSFSDNPLLEELPEPTPLEGPLSDNDIRARLALKRPGMKLRGVQSNVLQPRFNYRGLFKPKKRQEKNSEEAMTATKEHKIELEGRPVEFFFKECHTNTDADFGSVDDYDDLTLLNSDVSLFDTHEVTASAGKASDHTMFDGVSRTNEEACFEASDAKQLASNEADLCTVPPVQSSSSESCPRSNVLHSMADMSLALDSSVLVGPPGRALRKKRTAAMFA